VPIRLAFAVSALILPLLLTGPSHAQSIRLGPGGIEIVPEPERRGPPPREREGFQERERDELRERMFRLREACEDGDRRACVRFGMILGENRERQAEWRREHPEIFSFER
jgi:hypothetical protein